MSQGSIVEQGTHDQLLEKSGAYYNLVSAQKIAASEQLTAEEEAALSEKEELLIRKQSTNKEGQYIADPDDDIAAKLGRATTSKSASSMVLQKRQGEEEPKYSLWVLIKLIASFNGPELKYMLVGLFFSIICGGGNPTSAGKSQVVRCLLVGAGFDVYIILANLTG